MIWSRSTIVKCPECGIEQEIVFNTYNDPEEDGDVTSFAEDNYLDTTLGGLCNGCEYKIHNELVEIEKNRPLTEREQFYKTFLAPEEHEKLWTIEQT